MLRGTAGLASSTKDLGRQQHRLLSLHFSTALCVASTWKLDCPICKNPTLWFSIRHPPTWPRNYLLLVQRPGRQPFSKRHTHRPGMPAPHIFSFLVLSTAAIRNEFSTSSARGFMQATSLSLLLLYRNLAAHTLTLLFTYIIYCHVSWKPNTFSSSSPLPPFHASTRACHRFFRFLKCPIAKKSANKANPSVGRLSTEMKRKMVCRVTLGYSRRRRAVE